LAVKWDEGKEDKGEKNRINYEKHAKILHEY
jgi:hypothetical protein